MAVARTLTQTHVPVAGISVERVDARAKVTGTARYVADLPVADALVGRTVRSTVPHGVVRAIELDAAFDWTGITVATAADVPGRNCILHDTDDQPALVPIGGRVRHVGEAVALVAAPSRERVEAALAHVAVRVDPLPPVLTIEESLAETVLVADEGNVLHELHVERGDVDAAFTSADVVVEGTYRTGAAEQVYLETQGMVAWWDGDVVHVTGSMQCPYFVHRALGAAFEVAGDQIDVVQATTGGGFGGKEDYPSVLATHAALLARCTGRPVRMIYERAEDLAATTKRHPSLIHHRIAATADGRLLAADVDLVLDAGAYVTLSPIVLLRSVLHATGPYRIPAVRVRGRAVATNHVPSGAYRGFGVPQAAFAAERQMTKLARAVGTDDLTLRKANALLPGDSTSTGGVLDDSAALPEVLDELERALDRPREHGRPRATGNVRRGRGIAASFHGAGFSGSGEALFRAKATVDLTAEGTFRVLTSCVDMGQGARTVLAQIAADTLGVDLSLVDVPEPSTLVVPDTGPTVASRTTLVAGTVVARAAARLRHDIERGVAGADGDGLPSVTEEFTLPSEVVWDQATLTGSAYPTYAWAATAVEVAVDEDTSEVTVERCIQAVDAGFAINPVAVEGQIHGGTLQALGWALTERVVDHDGEVANPSLSTLAIPTAVDAPEIEAIIVEVPYAHGPMGAKGIGEMPLDGPAAAIVNAVVDAIGVDADEIPLLPESIHRLRGGR